VKEQPNSEVERLENWIKGTVEHLDRLIKFDAVSPVGYREQFLYLRAHLQSALDYPQNIRRVGLTISRPLKAGPIVFSNTRKD
jgi:hypothetical protein